MKIYEGAGLVADRADACIVPVRIDGPQFSPFSYLGGKTRRRWFPRLSMTIMAPVALDIDPGLRGRARRRAVGVALQGVMEQAGFAARDIDRSLFPALLGAKARFGAGMRIAEDVERRPISYARLVVGAVTLGRRLAKLAPVGERVGVMLPNSNGGAVCFFACRLLGLCRPC